jgi:hypothetical protein
VYSVLPRATPESNWFRWKVHRFVLRKIKPWLILKLPSGAAYIVRHRSEGTNNYVFDTMDDTRLLRITRKQFYRLDTRVDEQQTQDNCSLMNSLAEWHLSVRAQHLAGGACLVEDAGRNLRRMRRVSREEIRAWFERLEKWSLQTGKAIFDFNAGNFCYSERGLRFVDVEQKFVCPLQEITANKLVRQRVATDGHRHPEQILAAFLEAEEQLLWDHLS